MKSSAELLQDAVHTLAKRGELPAQLANGDLDLDDLIDGAGLDSLGLTSLMAELEARTNVELPENALETFTRFRDVVDYLDRARGAK